MHEMINATSSFPLASVYEEPKESLELERIEERSRELDLPSDDFDQLKRRILIALHTYGLHNLHQVASFIGGRWTKEAVSKLLESKEGEWYKKELADPNKTPCWTKAELISRLCVEAETASSPKDRINAICKLMEFRGLAAPEGGSRNFSRTIMKFKK